MRVSLNSRNLLCLPVIAFTAFAVLPGHPRSPFSGIPFSSKTYATIAAILIVALCVALFPPRRSPRLRWTAALIVLSILKVLLAGNLVPEGWMGRYATAYTYAFPLPHLGAFEPVLFYGGNVRPYRVDRLIDFDGANFALFFVNDFPRPNVWPPATQSDDVTNPLRVRWTGYANADSPTKWSTKLTANGAATLFIDGKEVFRQWQPEGGVVTRVLDAGAHVITLDYDKPANVVPAVSMTPLPVPVTPFAVRAGALHRSRLSTVSIELLGFLAVLALAAALYEAYRPLLRFLLEDVWDNSDRVVVAAIVVALLAVAVLRAVPVRSTTMPLGFRDDPRAYEGMARLALLQGPLMTDRTHAPFFFYPFYPYALAAAHALLGEDYGAILFLNWLCIAVTIVLLWLLLRKWLSPGSTSVALLALTLFIRAYVVPYTHAPFTDNLFLPFSVAAVMAAAKALESRGFRWFFVTGILTALGAATRPSLMIFAPSFLAVIVLVRFEPIPRRAVSAGTFVAGFAAAIAPFTIRNWIVAHRFVLLISSAWIMVPMFLYSPDGRVAVLKAGGADTAISGLRAALYIFRNHPWATAAVEMRKILFTLGLTFAGRDRFDYPRLLVVFPLLFAFAVAKKRIPRPLLLAMGTFAISHLAAMVVATPFTYGYKAIVPFHFILAVGALLLLPQKGEALEQEERTPRPRSAARKTVSVVLPTYNEKDSIRQVILDFFAAGVVDEVIVVNNNAAAGTSDEVAGTGAREVFEPRQGYGAATRRGLREAACDYIVVCEPDGTFLPRDVLKLLAYADDFDVVYGSRTSIPLIWRGANMGFFLRFGNWAVARYMQLIFNAPSLTDVGCTFRLLHRTVAEALEGEFEADGSAFGAEMMVLTLRRHHRIVQVPLNYTERVGASSVTGDPGKAFWLGLQMIWLITRHRLRAMSEAHGKQDQSQEPQTAPDGGAPNRVPR